MESVIKLIIGEYDWQSTRLSPRKYYPPSLKKDNILSHPLTNADVNPKPVRTIIIPGVEGIGVSIGKYKGVKSLIVSFAHPTPFIDSIRIFAIKHYATWNDIFNVWDIPVLSQNKSNALGEIWDLIEESYFELPWSNIELHWNYLISEKSLVALSNRIEQLNNFWESGVIDYYPPEVNLVYQGLSKQEVIKNAIAAFYEYLPNAKWKPEEASTEALDKLCVNYLRHKCSSYHLLLKTELSYSKVFHKINEVIALCYPWLENEAKQQILRK